MLRRRSCTRENMLKHAISLKDEKLPLYLDGIKVYNSATDYRAVHNLQLSRSTAKGGSRRAT